MTDATPYVVPKEPGRWRAFALAALVHGALIGVLWFSVHWQSETPVAIEAEVWSPDVRAAAPVAPPPPPPEPEPESRPAPPPPKVVAAPPPPMPVVVEPPKVNPDIALAQEKKRKEKLQQERREDEQQARLEKQKAEKEAARREKLAADKEQAKRDLAVEKERAKIDQQKQAEAMRVDQQKKVAEAKKKSTDEAREKLERADDAQREKARNENLARMMAQAGSGGSGSAPKSQGPQGDPGYGSKVASKIRANTVFSVPGNLNGNPTVEYTVNLLPDGSLHRPIHKVRSSGVPGFDEAVLNAIERSEPFPADKTGKVPKFVTITHKPKD